MSKELCPQCGADYLRKHGYYERHLITVGFEGRIKIRRYRCRDCKKTVSLLPSFCHPKRTYGTEIIIKSLNEFYNKILTVFAVIMNILKTTGVDCSRQLLLHYRRRIEQNLNVLIMTLTDIQSLKNPIIHEEMGTKEKVRQLLARIHYPEDDSLKIYKRTGTTYLTLQPQ
ncbi:MAG: DUF6431 domain-containing protein [Treponema sp.]|nr:DUF6431 domain-containing protein [Treponema sp.]